MQLELPLPDRLHADDGSWKVEVPVEFMNADY